MLSAKIEHRKYKTGDEVDDPIIGERYHTSWKDKLDGQVFVLKEVHADHCIVQVTLWDRVISDDLKIRRFDLRHTKASAKMETRRQYHIAKGHGDIYDR